MNFKNFYSEKLYLTKNNILKYKKYFCGIRIKKIAIKKSMPTFNDKINDVLIVKIDSIGDYILIRNFFKVLKSDEKYKNSRITLLTTKAVCGIPEYLDANILDEVYYVKHPFWKLTSIEKFKELVRLIRSGLKTRYDQIIFPSMNINNYMDFNILITKAITADEYIIQQGDVNPFSDRVNEFKYFTKVFPIYNNITNFEFESNKKFFEQLLNKKIDLNVPNIDLNKNIKNEIVINPMSQEEFKNWHPYNYANLINKIGKKFSIPIVLVGSKSEFQQLNYIKEMCSCKISIKAGLPFRDLIDEINNAVLYIGNDSSCFHLAVSLGTPAICIAGISTGVAYSRFLKYPESEKYKVLVNNDSLEFMNSLDTKACYNRTPECLYANVNSVSVDRVFDEVLNRIQNEYL